MSGLWIAAILFLLVVLGGLAALGAGVLLRWYLHEVRRGDIPANPAEAIVTYPLA